MKKDYLIECLEKMKVCFDPVAPNYIEALDEAISYIKPLLWRRDFTKLMKD
jgi:hypothetical protein